MTHIDLHLATKLDGSETHMIAILVDSWGDKLVIPLVCDAAMGTGIDHIIPADYFTPCAHCGNAVLECNFRSGSDCCDRCTEGHKSWFKPYPKLQLPNGSYTIIKYTEDQTEEIIKTMDECIHWQYATCTGTCWISDICTKREELRKSTMLDMVETQTLPEDVMTMEDRIKTARQEAEDAFWAVIVKHFPEANDGSFLMSDMEDIMLSWVQHWVENNVPAATKVEPSWRGDLGELGELDLHYEDTWHLWHSDGGCMLAITDNVAVDCKHNYLVISSDCVCIYEDKFDDESWMVDHLTCWEYGDNPTVLMNHIDDFLGGTGYWDTGKLFDDIMTIAKSGKC